MTDRLGPRRVVSIGLECAMCPAFDAARNTTAGHNALRGSGPGQFRPKLKSRHARYSVVIGVKADIEASLPIYEYTP